MSAGESPQDLAVEMDVQLLSDRATLPTLGSDFAAGMDLYSAEAKTIPARGKALVDLQLSIAVPKGHYGRIAPRSGLVQPKDRIAQLILERISIPRLRQVETLDDTVRGSGGFGSTGGFGAAAKKHKLDEK
ncbi:hypothetical protein CI109_102198 [Kwoniella shandongensis]|uniref:dUTP diphosphatase n=1 Tax=Kwoniella shandongensis TaxID=1734106 RepID=A0AAJ8MWB5_9TREE